MPAGLTGELEVEGQLEAADPDRGVRRVPERVKLPLLLSRRRTHRSGDRQRGRANGEVRALAGPSASGVPSRASSGARSPTRVVRSSFSPAARPGKVRCGIHELAFVVERDLHAPIDLAEGPGVDRGFEGRRVVPVDLGLLGLAGRDAHGGRRGLGVDIELRELLDQELQQPLPSSLCRVLALPRVREAPRLPGRTPGAADHRADDERARADEGDRGRPGHEPAPALVLVGAARPRYWGAVALLATRAGVGRAASIGTKVATRGCRNAGFEDTCKSDERNRHRDHRLRARAGRDRLGARPDRLGDAPGGLHRRRGRRCADRPRPARGGSESPYAPAVAAAGGILLGVFLAIALDGVGAGLRRAWRTAARAAWWIRSRGLSCSRRWPSQRRGSSGPLR